MNPRASSESLHLGSVSPKSHLQHLQSSPLQHLQSSTLQHQQHHPLLQQQQHPLSGAASSSRSGSFSTPSGRPHSFAKGKRDVHVSIANNENISNMLSITSVFPLHYNVNYLSSRPLQPPTRLWVLLLLRSGLHPVWRRRSDQHPPPPHLPPLPSSPPTT